MSRKLFLSNNYKIGIVGSHSCGKTTLVKALCHRVEIPIIHELASKFPPEDRKYISTQYDIMRAQIDCEKAHKSFLSDRTVIDNLAYATLVYNTDPIQFKQVYTQCQQMAYKHLVSKPYNLIIFVNELLPLRPSPHRNFMEKHEQEFILNFIKYEFETSDGRTYCGIPYITVNGDLKDRIKVVMNYLKT